MQLTAKPERTYGLVVGIEKYHETAWNTGGQAQDALRFARWLCECGVPPENIRLCLSPLAENHHLLGECELKVESATEENLYDIVTNFLSQKAGDLLYIFWAGHGLISAERERRLICADATINNWLNLDLNSFLLLLSSDRFNIRHHICIIDACANYFLETQGRPTNLGGRIFPSGKPRTDSQQFVLLAAREGEIAKINTAEKTGYFSQAVREALTQANGSFPPDMLAVAAQVKQQFQTLDKKQLPTYFYYRNGDGDQEEYHYNPLDIPHNIQPSNAIKFVGRDEKIVELHQLLQENDVVVVSDETGEGGVGKTELAIQYSWQHLADYPGGCCWLNPQGVELGTQLVEFGVVNFSNFHPPQELTLNGKVAYCWRNWQAGKALLVFDDVKDWKQIKDYLPAKGSRFKVLITTRQNTGLIYPYLQLGELSPDAALELLTKLLGNEYVQQETETAKKICELMGYIPIGLYQVAAYSRKSRGVLC
ncbi:caspase family protein [Anabaena azotica FACHB-119]|uniref:Caspase family protein n=2 Tax=Anabaena azotica TaxID=197653 RepID=A0ABR8D6S9_9NOST|nr:caspase family protein [Anabaena azotica FACHB-119]